MFRRRRVVVAAALLSASVLMPQLVSAQLPTFAVGRTPTDDEIAKWDLTIPPDGRGLPPGSGTAAAGKAVFVERCATCHGENGRDPKYNVLVGGAGTLSTAKPVRTIGSFWPYATTLWSYIHRAQPLDDPGSLTADQVYAVTAYLLYLNEIIGEREVIDATTLVKVRMPNRDGFVPDVRPDVGAVPRSRAPQTKGVTQK
jgi:S-disulfanyl-L-cysteine oxidoreductase SoxD